MLPSHPGSYLQQTCQVRAKPAPSTHVGGSGECLIQTHAQPWVPGDTPFPPSPLMWSHHYLSLHLPFQIRPVHAVIFHHIPSSLAFHLAFSLPAPSTPLPCVVHTHLNFWSMLYIYMHITNVAKLGEFLPGVQKALSSSLATEEGRVTLVILVLRR